MRKLLILLSIVVVAAQIYTGLALWSVRTKLSDLAPDGGDAAGSVSVDRGDTLNQLSQRLSSLESTLSATQKQFVTLGEKVDEQATLTGRAIGEIIPYKLPDDVSRRIAEIQQEIDRAILSPSEAASVERMRSEIASIVDTLPPWAQEEALPTLVPLRWNLEALWVVANAGNVWGEDLEGFVKSIDVLLDNRPLESSDSLASTLDDQRKSVEARIAAEDKALALEKAAQSLESRDAQEVAVAIDRLAPYTDDAQAKKLSRQLKTMLTERMVAQAADDLDKSIGQYKRLTSVPMRQYAFARASQTAVELRLQLISAGVSDMQLINRLQHLHDTAREQELHEIAAERRAASQSAAAQRKKYQVWALNQIRNVRSLETLKKSGLKEPQALLQLRQDMTRYLAPIDEGLLDVAVGQWFRKVYSSRFEELADDGKPKLIASFASTPKMTFEMLP